MKPPAAASLLVVALACPAWAEAQDTEWNRYTLEDLGGVFIEFEGDDVCDAAGVNAAAYEADVSMKLIEADVDVLTRDEMLTHPAMPELRISLDCVKGPSGSAGTMAYAVGLRVQQAAQMLRDTQITLPEAVTWYTTAVGVTSDGAAVEAVGATLMELIDGFAAAWRAIHEEPGSGQGAA